MGGHRRSGKAQDGRGTGGTEEGPPTRASRVIGGRAELSNDLWRAHSAGSPSEPTPELGYATPPRAPR